MADPINYCAQFQVAYAVPESGSETLAELTKHVSGVCRLGTGLRWYFSAEGEAPVLAACGLLGQTSKLRAAQVRG